MWSLFSSRGQIFSLDIRLTKLTIPRSAKFFRRISFFYSLHSLRIFIFWRPHGNSYASSPGDEWTATNYVSSPVDEWMATNLFSVVWKFTMCWFSWRVLPWYQIWSKACLPADTHMANREWGPSNPTSSYNGWERWTVFLSINLLTVRWFLSAIIVRWRPNVLGCHISSSQYIYIYIYIYIYMIWSAWILWLINHCRFFKAKSCLYIYIKYIWFGLFGFFGISIIVGYLIANFIYTCIFNIYDFI